MEGDLDSHDLGSSHRLANLGDGEEPHKPGTETDLQAHLVVRNWGALTIGRTLVLDISL